MFNTTYVRCLTPLLVLSALISCSTTSMPAVPRGLARSALPLDLARFMGDWYVLAHIPTRPERNAFSALEQYSLRDDGRIDIRFSFCEGGLDGQVKTMKMLGWVHDESTNAEWRVRPFWPLSLDYQILELDPEYSLTVIGHPSKRYAWVMARSPEVESGVLDEITGRLTDQGFDTSRLRLVPQSEADCRIGAKRG